VDPDSRNSFPAVSFEAFGVNTEVALGDPELEPHVREILPPGFRECAPAASAGRFGLWQIDEETYEVTFDGAPGLEHATLAVALTLLDAEIRLHIAANARDLVFVHAGVVARDGRALVIPGESFCGKTTLVSALVKAGATYYSDEYAVLDKAGYVHPYPRPLSIRSTEGSAGRERRAPDLGAVAGDERATLAAVAVTRYRPGLEWNPNRVSRGQGMVALLANTVPAQERPEQSLRTLSRAVAGATMLEGDRGEAGPVARALLDELRALTR
jgi:hypothetical protein